MKIISAFFILVSVVLAMLAASVFGQVQPQCAPWFHRGHEVQPATWGSGSANFYVEGYPGITVFTYDLCNNMRFTSPPNANGTSVGGYILSFSNTSNTGTTSNFPVIPFDVSYSVDNGDYASKYLFSTSIDNNSFAEVVVTCNSTHEAIAPNHPTVNVRNDTFGKVYTFHMGVRDLCDIFTTSVPTTAPAPTGSTTAVPSVPCAELHLGGDAVNPNNWGDVYAQLDVPAFPGSETWFMGNLCRINPSFTPAPNFAQVTGYFLLAPLGSVYNPVAFNRRELAEVNLEGQFVKYRFSSSFTPNTKLLVYIFCKRDMPQLGFVSNDLISFNNSQGGTDFEIYLGVADVCPVTTTRPPGACNPFVNTAGETKHPGSFLPGQGLLKDVMTGESVMTLVDLCNKNHFTAVPGGPTFQPGYVVFYPDQKQTWPQISFDVLASQLYLGFANELRMTYQSTMANRTEDQMIVSVTCGGGRGLTFTNRYVFPRRNTKGGNTYEIQVATQAMCNSTTRAPTSAAPTTQVPVTSGATSGAVPVTSGATSGAVPVTSGATSGAVPVTSGATSGAVPVTSDATSGAVPVTSGATSGAVPVTSDATSGAVPVTSGATSGAVPVTSDATSGEAPVTSLSPPPPPTTVSP